MNKIHKLHKKVVSLFLSMLMVLSTLIGYIPMSDVPVQAAGMNNLEKIDQGTDFVELVQSTSPGTNLNPDTLKIVKLQTGLESMVNNNSIDNKFTQHYTDKNKAYWVQEASGSLGSYSFKTKPSVTYFNAGKDQVKVEGKPAQSYNLTVTLESCDFLKGEVHESTNISSKATHYWNPDTGKGHTSYVVKPHVRFTKGSVGIGILGIANAKFSFEWTKFTKRGEKGDPLTKQELDDFFAYVTLDDLDAAQGFSIPSSSNIMGIYKLKSAGDRFIKYNSELNRIMAVGEGPDRGLDPKDPEGWVQVLLHGTNKWSMTFSGDPGYCALDPATGKYRCMGCNVLSGGVPQGVHFGLTSKSLIDFTNITPNDAEGSKRVGPKGVSYAAAYDAEDRDSAYKINDYDDYDYIVRANVPTYEVEKYEITDTLEACLAIDDAAHVSIIEKTGGKDVTGNFNITVTGNTIKCVAKPEYLKSDYMKSVGNEKKGNELDVRYTVHRIKTEDVYTFMAPWIDPDDGFTFYVPNHATVTWHDQMFGTKTEDTNICWVTDKIGCELVIEKDAKYDDWKVGDLVTYAVEVSQVKQDGYAKNVVVTDADIPSCLKLVNNEWNVDGPVNGEAASISSDGQNGWIVTCPLLQYNDSIKIEFKCLVLEEANGKDWINTAFATADNFLDGSGDDDEGSTREIGDSAEIWVNSPVLTVDKTANAYEYEVGDTVRYTVTVNNAADYTVAKNVVVSDISLPEGLELQGDVAVDMGDAQTSIGWPVKDGTTTISKESIENEVTVEPTVTPFGNTWTVKAKYLPSKQPMTITFNCKATKAVNGIETQNVVKATADNFLSLDQTQEPQTAQDDAEIYVNTAAFDIDKKVPDETYEWQVGDHVPFDVTIRNINDENTLELANDPKYADLSDEENAKIGAAGKTVARNVVITDKDIPDGFILDFNSIEASVPRAQSVDEEIENALAGLELEDTADEAAQIEAEVNAQLDALGDAEADVLKGLDAIGVDETSDTTSEEDELLAQINALGLEDETESEDINADSLGIEPYSEDGIDPLEDNPPEPTVDPTQRPARPADEMTVTGIPDSFADHIPGTPDKTNDVTEEVWNETVDTPITKELIQEGNGWKLLISNLPAGNEVNIHFTCEATQDGNGKEGVNIGEITADNAITKSDDSEAYINTASLSIDKQLVNKYAAGGAEDKHDNREGYEFRVGEDIEYKLIVNNTQKGSIARNVVISDVTIPEGLELDMSSITIENLPATYVNPIAGTIDESGQLDPDHYKETEILPIVSKINQVENGFQVLIDNLPCTTGDELNQMNTPVVITYHCMPTDMVNGVEIINTGKAEADNATEVKDKERIWVNSPVLYVDKEADRDQYLPGDTITYRVDLVQDRTGCLARNITFHDVIDTPGVKLQKNSVVLIDSDGLVIQPKNVIINDDNSFTVETGLNLIKEEEYSSIDLDNANEETGENGWQQMGAFNPPDVKRESKLSLEYAVEIVDGNLAGQIIHNKITADSDEKIPVEDEEEVPVYGPALDIEKVSDKVEYQVGEEAFYSLTIRNIREDTIVKQVVIDDGFDKEGMTISNINVRLNGKNIEVKEIIRDKDNHFRIDTGIDMNDTDKLEVHYKVVFNDPELHGQDLINVAVAKGENTDEEQQDNCVRIVDETPGLSIDKSSDKQEYKVGDIGHYTVIVKNTERDTVARNVIIKDHLYVDGASILPDTIKIFNDAGKLMDDAEIQHSDKGYAIVTGHDLEYKDEMKVTYDVLFEKETLAGQDILNIARATCDNLRVETEDPDPIDLPNGLSVHKFANPVTGSVVKNGEDITYFVSIKNNSNVDMKNVLVKDMIPEYTEYVSSEDQPGVLTGTRVLDGKEYATFVIEELKSGDEKIVSFTVTVKDAPEEEMLFNVAQVRVTKFDIEDMDDTTWTHEAFRNTNEVVHYTDTRWIKDENIVHIDGGYLGIEKASDKLNYSVGEIGHYTVTVTQKVDGAVARNVMVSDALQNAGAVIQKDSIKAFILRNGAEEEEELKDIIVTAKNQRYIVETGSNLKYGEKLFIRYDVLFESAELEGQQVKNVAMAKDDSTPEGQEPTDDNRVTVGDAGLIIEKTSDKHRYEVGDIGKYVLKVTCSDPSRTIKNVVVKDVMKQIGAHLVGGTVRTYYDNEELKVNVQEQTNGFLVETHHDLSGTHAIWVTYDVVFESATLLEGRDIENQATTWGDNTTPSDDKNIVHVGPGDGPHIPDYPDWPDRPIDPDPRPTPPAGPTPTPVPPSPDMGMNITKSANKHDVQVGETVSYTLEARVNSGSDTAENVVITDTIDPALAKYVEIVKDSIRSYLDNAEFHGEDLNVTEGGFTLKTGKNLAPGQVIKVTYDVKMLGEELKGQTVKNTATVSADNMDTAKDKEAVNVKTDEPREGGMTLIKNANKTTAKVGDVISYTLEARTNSGEKTAENVVLKDAFDQSVAKYVEVNKDSFRCYLDDAQFQPKELNLTEAGFTILTGKDLAPGQVIKITYDVTVKSEELKGQNIKNTATVSSDNMEPAKDNDIVNVETDKPVEGGMNLVKSANKAQVKVGETVAYTLEARVNSGTDTAKNVVLRDNFDSAVAKYMEIEKNSFRCYIDNAEFRPKSLNLTTDGFTLTTGKDLKPGQVMKVTYDVLMKGSELKGMTVKNSAIVSSDNMEPGKDNELVVVEKDQPTNGGLDLTKTSNRSQINIGETVKYTLTARTTSSDTAKNVVIKDTLNEKVILDKASIKAYIDNQVFSPEKLSVVDNGFTMETGKDLAAGQVMKVVYEVRFADASLGGKTVKNTAVIDADNMDPVDDSSNVDINEPAPEPAPELSIDKVANVYEAEVGDSVKYVVTVKQTVKGQTAENVVITDSFDSEGMKVKDVRATLNGKTINVSMTKSGNGFSVDTGVDLEYGATLKLTYLATVSSESLKGEEVRNTAVAESDNTDPVIAEAGISVKPDPEPTVVPDDNNNNNPDNNGPKQGDDTTNTIGPKTGLVNNAGVYAGIGIAILAIAAIAFYVMRRKNKK